MVKSTTSKRALKEPKKEQTWVECPFTSSGCIKAGAWSNQLYNLYAHLRDSVVSDELAFMYVKRGGGR